jgi:hypothetical protein
MTVSPDVTAAVAARWRLALAEADIEEADAHLLAVEGRAPADEPKAAAIPPAGFSSKRRET